MPGTSEGVEWISPKEAAHRTGGRIAYDTIARYVREGILAHVRGPKKGSRILVRWPLEWLRRPTGA